MKSRKVSGVLLYLLGLVLVLLLYFNFVFTPMNVKVAQLDAEHQKNTQQIQLYDRQMGKADELKNKIAEMQQELEQTGQSTAVNGKAVAEDIDAACRAAGIVPAGIQVNGETVVKNKTSWQGKPLCSVSVKLNAVCTNAQLTNLLHYFESQTKGAYYVNTVTRTQQQTDITLTLYYFGAMGTKG